MCKILIGRQAATVSKDNSPPRFGIAFVVGKWGPRVNMDMNAKALPQCSGKQSRPVVVYYSITWAMSQIQTRHYHVAFQSQGHVCPLILALLCVLKKKEPELSSVAYSAMGLEQDIQCPKEQTCFCFHFLPTQGAAWGLRCRQPMASCPPESQAGKDPGVVSNALPPREGPVLLPGYGCLGKGLQNVFQVQLN